MNETIIKLLQSNRLEDKLIGLTIFINKHPNDYEDIFISLDRKNLEYGNLEYGYFEYGYFFPNILIEDSHISIREKYRWLEYTIIKAGDNLNIVEDGK